MLFLMKTKQTLSCRLKCIKTRKHNNEILKKSFITTEEEIVALPFHRAVCIGCTIVKSHCLHYSSQHFQILGWNLVRNWHKCTHLQPTMSIWNCWEQTANQSTNVSWALFQMTSLKHYVSMETRFVALDNCWVLTVCSCQWSAVINWRATYETNFCKKRSNVSYN